MRPPTSRRRSPLRRDGCGGGGRPEVGGVKEQCNTVSNRGFCFVSFHLLNGFGYTIICSL